MSYKLGRGLEALISSKDPYGSKRDEMLAREKLQRIESELKDLKERTQTLRKQLTMEIVLGSNPDIAPLKELESRIIELEIDRKDLLKEISTYGPPEEPEAKEQSAPPAPDPGRSRDIDMDMIRTMIESVDDLDDDRVGGDDPRVRTVDRAQTISSDPDYIRSIQEEIHPKVVLRRIKAEVKGMPQEGPVATPVPGQGAGITAKRLVRRVKPRIMDDTGGNEDIRSVLKKAMDLSDSGRNLEALATLEVAFGRYGREGDIYILNAMGNVYVGMDELDKAQEKFRLAVKMNPADSKAIGNLGIVLMKQKRYEESIRILNQALEVDPNYERAWFNLGKVFMEIDPPLLKEASIFLKRAIEIDPRYEKAREYLKRCMDMMKTA